MKVTRWKLLLPLALLVAFGTVATSGALATTAQSGDVKIAIMTDCKGQFAFGYEVDTAGAIAAFSQYAGAKPKNKKKPSAGMIGGRAGGKKLNIVGIGCGDETPALALKETRRLMVQLGGEVMLGPLSGDESVAIANWAKQNPTEDRDHRHGRRRRIRRCRSRRRTCSATTATAPSGTPASGRSSTRSSAGARPRSSATTTASRGRPAAGIIADFCGIGGKITKRVWTPPQRWRLRPVHPPAADAGPGRRVLLARRRCEHRRRADGVRAGRTGR